MDKTLGYKLGSALDSVISVFSPKMALQRRSWRNTYYGYDASSPTRKDEAFPWDSKAEAINKGARRTLRARARDLERNSDIIAGILEALDRNVIGTGFSMQAQTRSKRFNERIEKLWKEWTHAENCDVAETQSFTEMLRMALRRQSIDGGILFVYCTNKNKKIPLQIQMREVDDFYSGDIPYDNKTGSMISEGVEITTEGKPIAYYLTTTDPLGFENTRPERVSVDRVSFLWNKTRPSQYREITPFAKAITRIKDLEDYNQAVAFQQKTQACMSAFVETDNMVSAVGRPTNTVTNERLEQISAGSVNYLSPGERIKTLIPTGQASEVENYIVTQLRLVSSGQGISLEGASRNVERVNYSSARQNLIEDNKTYGKIRDYLVEHLLRVVYKRFVKSCYLAGLLDGVGFNPNDDSFYEATWLAVGMPWIDPKKEAEADNIGLINNTTTLQAVCARNGLDWQDVLDQREREQKELEKRGLVPTLTINQNEKKGEQSGTDESGE